MRNNNKATNKKKEFLTKNERDLITYEDEISLDIDMSNMTSILKKNRPCIIQYLAI